MERSGARAAAKTRDVRIALLFAALAMALALARPIAGGGVGLDIDAVNYISVADSITAGDGFRQVFENDHTLARYTRTEAREPYVRWAPLWPVLLAAASPVPFLTTQTAALPLNVFAFGALSFACSLWLIRNLSSRRVALWFALVIALSPPLARMTAWAQTETLFSLFLVLALMVLEARLRGSAGRRALCLGVACVALACLLRYSGLAITVFGAAALLLLPRQEAVRSVRARSADAAAWLLSAIPVGFWMARNVAIGHRPTGVREPPHVSLQESLAEHLYDLGGWLTVHHPFWTIDDTDMKTEQAAAITCTLALIAWRTRKCWFNRVAWRGCTVLSFGGFAALYFTFLVFWASVSYLYPLGGRHLVPLYAPIALVLALLVDRSDFRRIYPIAILFAILHVGDTVLTFSAMERVRALQSGGLARYLQQHDSPPSVIISNRPATIYLLTSGQSDSYPLLPAIAHEAAIAISDNPDGTWIVWAHGDGRGNGFGLEELRNAAGLEQIADLPDGVVFRVRRAASRSPRMSCRASRPLSWKSREAIERAAVRRVEDDGPAAESRAHARSVDPLLEASDPDMGGTESKHRGRGRGIGRIGVEPRHRLAASGDCVASVPVGGVGSPSDRSGHAGRGGEVSGSEAIGEAAGRTGGLHHHVEIGPKVFPRVADGCGETGIVAVEVGDRVGGRGAGAHLLYRDGRRDEEHAQRYDGQRPHVAPGGRVRGQPAFRQHRPRGARRDSGYGPALPLRRPQEVVAVNDRVNGARYVEVDELGGE